MFVLLLHLDRSFRRDCSLATGSLASAAHGTTAVTSTSTSYNNTKSDPFKKRIIYNTTITLATLYTSGGADTRGILAWRSVWSALAAASARAFA